MNTQAQDLFTRALELPESERDSFLAQACGDNAELHLEVQRMLVDAARADSFFGDADGATLGAEEFKASYAEKEGDVVGPYKLRQRIGEGGFGVVWMAEQSVPISRMVALKVIKAGMDTRQVLARFEAERQAVAMMDHPHIAKVLDAGATATGRPWFAMELVKGIPITDYCDQAGLGTKERLALFGEVCAAINHAHQKGIIHRDIKPSNVMVTLHGDQPVVKVIDFGIAKATQGKLTDQTLFTRFEQFIGTPAYMSPEQAALSGLDIDTRSDIYSLGVMLYELLTGKPPFDGRSLASAGFEEMRRIIREVEPPKPSSRLSTVAGDERTQLAKSHRIDPEKISRLVEPDLDWIVMKAIEKDRTRRYETANAFAQDIVRFLADEPVSARPPGAGYQFRKFARRNKAALRVATAIAGVMVAGTAVSTGQAVRATAAEKKTSETLAEVAAERDAKELARRDAEDIATFLGEVFQSPDPTRDGREIKVVELLDKAVGKLATDLADQPARRVKLQITLGRTYLSLGLAQRAVPLLEQARDHHLGSFGADHPETLKVMHLVANSYAALGRREESLELREKVLELSRKVLGPQHSDTLDAMNNLAMSYHDAGRRDAALEMRREVLALRQQVNGAEHPATLLAMNNLALSLHAAGHRDEALQIKEKVLELRRKVLAPEHPDTILAMNNVAASYSDAGRWDEELKMCEEVLALSRKVNGPEHPETIKAMGNLAFSYTHVGRRDEALDLREKVLVMSREVNGSEHPYTIDAMRNLAFSYHDAGRRDEELKLEEEVLALTRRVNGAEHPETLSALNNLSLSYMDAGRREESIKMQEEVLELFRKVMGPEHPDTLKAMGNLAISLSSLGRGEEAIKMQEEVLALSRKVLGQEHPGTVVAMNNLASFCYDAGRRDEAIKLQEEVLPLLRKVNGPEHPDTILAMHNLAISYHDTGHQDQALPLREEVLRLSRKVNGPEHVFTAFAMANLGESRAFADRRDEAIELMEQALALNRRLLPPDHPFFAVALQKLADLHEMTGGKDRAKELRAELDARSEKPE